MAISFLGLAIADWYFFTVVGIFVVACVLAGYWYYISRVKIGYKAVFSVLLHGEPVLEGGKKVIKGGVRKVLAEKEFKASDSEVRFRKKTFKVDLRKPAYQWFGWTRFYYDFESGDILTFGGVFQGLNPKDADIFMNEGLIARALAFVGQKKAEFMVVIIVMGVLCGVCFAVGLFALGIEFTFLVTCFCCFKDLGRMVKNEF